jgi:hypothetical protein
MGVTLRKTRCGLHVMTDLRHKHRWPHKPGKIIFGKHDAGQPKDLEYARRGAHTSMPPDRYGFRLDATRSVTAFIGERSSC